MLLEVLVLLRSNSRNQLASRSPSRLRLTASERVEALRGHVSDPKVLEKEENALKRVSEGGTVSGPDTSKMLSLATAAARALSLWWRKISLAARATEALHF